MGRVHRFSTIVLGALLLTAGCGGEDGADTPEQVVFGGDRPVTLRVPENYDHDTPTPLLMVLHGHGVTGAVELAYSRLDNLLRDPGILILAPDGTVDPDGNHFWNAETGWCCDFYDSGVDDVGYLGSLLDEVRAVYNVDPARIYLFGHSNGAVMAYTMACVRAQEIAAVIALAGTSFFDAADCSPSDPVSILHIHGTEDDTVLFEGGTDCLGHDCVYPGVDETLDHWAGYNGCALAREPGGTIDLDSGLEGAETNIERYTGCPTGIDIALWTIVGGAHIPTLRNDVYLPLWSWLEEHPEE